MISDGGVNVEAGRLRLWPVWFFGEEMVYGIAYEGSLAAPAAASCGAQSPLGVSRQIYRRPHHTHAIYGIRSTWQAVTTGHAGSQGADSRRGWHHFSSASAFS
jgi:hypothetical protein